MRLKKLIIALGIILALLMIVATAATFFSGDISQPKENVSIAITGDVMFARNMAGVLSLDSSPFAGVSNVTSKVDLLIVNFENAATNSTNAVKGDVPLRCSPEYVPLLLANNNTIATLANNHVFDYGVGGMRDTVSVLNKSGIVAIGAGENETEAHAGSTQVINGRNITVFNYMDSNNFAEYGYEVMPYANGSSPGYSAYDGDTARQQISQARGNGSDFIIVSMHFGNEYSRSPNEDQIRISHELIDAGADVVIGAHPHVTQGIEMYNGKPICYSLGNFIFDQSNTVTHRAYFVQIDLVNDTGLLTVYPVNINGYLPYFMPPSEGSALLNELNPQCSQLNITDEGIGRLMFNLTTDN